jgi:hypothetical protein
VAGDSASATTAAKDTAWKIGGNFGIQFNQSAYSNWQAGGINSLSGNGLLLIFADYDNGGKWSWKNNLVLGYGVSYQDTFFTKTDDRMELSSRADRKISEHWAASAMVNFKSQFANGYQNPGETDPNKRISAFMAPAYTMAGLGFTYKPNKAFNGYISPVTAKLTIVNDDSLSAQGAFGVDPGETTRWEIGAHANLTYVKTLMENVDLKARLDLFSNYMDGQYKYVDVSFEMLLFMKVNKFITANFAFSMAYDNDIMFDVNNDGILDGPRTQFKEVIGVGLSYNFGHVKKK